MNIYHRRFCLMVVCILLSGLRPGVARADEDFTNWKFGDTMRWLKSTIVASAQPLFGGHVIRQSYTDIAYEAGVLTITADAEVAQNGSRTIIVRFINTVQLNEVQTVVLQKNDKADTSTVVIVRRKDAKNITITTIYDVDGQHAQSKALPSHCMLRFGKNHREARDCVAALQHLIASSQ